MANKISAEAAPPSGVNDALTGALTAAAFFELGVICGLPDRLRALALYHAGPVADSALLLVIAVLLGGLAYAVQRSRRLSREVAALRRHGGPELTSPMADIELPYIAARDVLRAPGLQFPGIPPRRTPRTTSES